MTATLLDGKALARELQAELAQEIAEFIANNGAVPCLAVVLVGENPASEVYVRNKQKTCGQLGIVSELHRQPVGASEEDLLALIHLLNRNKEVHGILVQLPLPAHMNEHRALQAVHPLKDVDAFHPENVGRLVQGRPRFLPCTPQGIQQLLVRNGLETAGKHVVVVGRSEIVGKPIANMLLQRGPGAEATVTVCHSRTPDLAHFTRQADILIVAIGRPRFITGDMVKPGAVVIDVGINRTDTGHGVTGLCGDVDFDSVCEVAGHLTPVPGGVGPLTIAMLLRNTLHAARLQEQ